MLKYFQKRDTQLNFPTLKYLNEVFYSTLSFELEVLRKIPFLIYCFWKIFELLRINEKYPFWKICDLYFKLKYTLWYTFQSYKIKVYTISLYFKFINLYLVYILNQMYTIYIFQAYNIKVHSISLHFNSIQMHIDIINLYFKAK